MNRPFVHAQTIIAASGFPAGRASSVAVVATTIADCVAIQKAAPYIDASSCNQDDLIDILKRIGAQHRLWLVNLWKSHEIHQEPIMNDSGQIIVDFLFWFEHDGMKRACFENGTADNEVFADSLVVHRIRILDAGDEDL